MVFYDINYLQKGDKLHFQYIGGTHTNQLRHVIVEEVYNDRVLANDGGFFKSFLKNKMKSVWIERDTFSTVSKNAVFSVSLNSVLKAVELVNPNHTIDFDGKNFNFYRKV